MRDVAMFGAPGGTVMRHSSPLRRYRAAEVMGSKAIMTTTPNRRDATPHKLRGLR
jgi:hypothetical protein